MLMCIYKLGLECHAHITNSSCTHKIIDANVNNLDETICFATLYDDNVTHICYDVYEYQQVQMVETKQHIYNDHNILHGINAIETCEQEEKKRLHSCNEEITDFVRADDNSSRSNIARIIAQNEMKSEKAQAAFKLFREYDYRIQCEGKQPGCVDPIRLYFQKKRMQRILAVSKRRKLLISKHQKKKDCPNWKILKSYLLRPVCLRLMCRI